ncbi:predicted protein [Sparassis crispa]|uniref:Protein kinase domain-containing protein n=1 Tax=Sparassis crispa TaxID=139825 RepID=A0A401GX54_9APHY|nr:predicted protein [Sparassis crispa]GBE86801.1 predicted protein [Sparassis crispa]
MALSNIPPSHHLSSNEEVRRYAKSTKEGIYPLSESEVEWRDRYAFLERNGLQLQPRYHLEWRPSWLETGESAGYCEDSAESWNPDTMDATQLGEPFEMLSIKSVKRKWPEFAIASQLSNFATDPSNHCVPIQMLLDDPLYPHKVLMVTPYLHPFNEPELSLVHDVMDFVKQTLEGLRFLHDHNIAYRDCNSRSIMMDARSLYPQGHHPININSVRSGFDKALHYDRLHHPVKYYFANLSKARQFQPGRKPYVVYKGGEDIWLPEWSSKLPYDAFKADVYHLGSLFESAFLRADEDLQCPDLREFLEYFKFLVTAMTYRQPKERITASYALFMAEKITSLIPEEHMSMTLWKTPILRSLHRTG